MAWYNPSTDKIIDAIPGSLAYWHERGHQLLHRKFSYYYRVQSWRLTLTFVLLFFIVRPSLPDARLALAALVVLEYWDEVFAWGYAFYHKPPFKGRRTRGFLNNI